MVFVGQLFDLLWTYAIGVIPFISLCPYDSQFLHFDDNVLFSVTLD